MLDSVVTNTKQEFDLHMAALTDTQKLLLDNTAKVAGFLLLALGWLATSEDARNYLTDNPRVAIVFVAAILIAYVMAAALNWPRSK